jgi:hypothetical protein
VADNGSITGLLELRSQLQMDAGLDSFLTEKYGKSATHIVGFKEAANVNDYPYICYVENMASRGGLGGDLELISLVVGIYDPEIDGNISRGVANLAIVESLIIGAINTDWSGSMATFLGTTKTLNNFAIKHPVYQKEIQVQLKVKRKL